MVLNCLHSIISEDRIRSSDNLDHPLGNSAQYIVYPQTEAEVASILKMAYENSFKVIPVGGGTKRGFGGIEQRADILLSLAHVKGIVEHSVGDMTLSVLPGTTMQEIADELAKQNQMVPLDPTFPEQATIGGVIASNDSGPKRMRYGSARDHVIGLRIAYPDGSVLRTGGKVVKNVAGYDMNKLFVGSMGTLGVLTEVTLKLRPLPKYTGVLHLTFTKSDPDANIADLHSFILKVLDTHLEPVTLECLSPQLNERLNQVQGYGLSITFEDGQKAVESQIKWVRDHLPDSVQVHTLVQDEAHKWWKDFAHIAHHEVTHHEVAQDEATQDEVDSGLGTSNKNIEDVVNISLKLGSKNLATLELVQHAHLLGSEEKVHVEAHGGAGHGISKIFVRGKMERVLHYVQKMRQRAEEQGGYCIVKHAPVDMRQSLDVWGKVPDYFPIVEGIKKKIDPRFVLNAKRFVGGI